METPGEEDPFSHDTIPHTVPHPPDGIASPTNSAEDFTQPPVDLSRASDHNTPRGTVQHHDYHHSTVPTQLAQPMDVEASFPQDMMEASVAGAVASGYTLNMATREDRDRHSRLRSHSLLQSSISSSTIYTLLCNCYPRRYSSQNPKIPPRGYASSQRGEKHCMARRPSRRPVIDGDSIVTPTLSDVDSSS
ncbi:hypothetical protein V1264_006117 [Littorina saxatilis]|uniref:Uncharacterized protein n=1 Tax=Littorina saxatilis TaxID=31220 RepID=A0AAN9AWE7_9CAEN